MTDVSIWAGQTHYSAHRLVLALSSSYFKLVVTGAAQEGRHPVIFLKVRVYLYHLYFGESGSMNGFECVGREQPGL